MGRYLSDEKLEKWRRENPNIRVIHRMADGSVRDSVEGYFVPYNEETKALYHLLGKMLRKEARKRESALCPAATGTEGKG